MNWISCLFSNSGHNVISNYTILIIKIEALLATFMHQFKKPITQIVSKFPGKLFNYGYYN